MKQKSTAKNRIDKIWGKITFESIEIRKKEPILNYFIDKKISIGLEIDKTICYEFQKNSKDKNLIFSTGIDLIYELFKFESKINNQLFSKSIKAIGNSKLINSFFKKFADKGLRV